MKRSDWKAGIRETGFRLRPFGPFVDGMGRNRLAVAASLAVLALSAQTGCRMMAIVPHEDMPLETSTPAAAERAIRAGASLRGWVSEVVSPELVRCCLDNRGCRVVVDVYHGANKFSVRYAGSLNMGYKPSSRRIHRKYNQWVANLVQDIQRAGMMMGPEPGSRSSRRRMWRWMQGAGRRTEVWENIWKMGC